MKKDLAGDELKAEGGEPSSLIALVSDGEAQLSISEVSGGLRGNSFAAFRSVDDLFQALQRRMTFDAVFICFSGNLDISEFSAIKSFVNGPIIFLFERGKSEELLKAVAELATDLNEIDFIVSPFDSREVDLRLNFLMRKFKEKLGVKTLSWGQYSFSMRNCMVTFGEAKIHLKPREFYVALELFRNMGRVLTRDWLMRVLWSDPNGVGSRTLDVCISNIRSKLGLKPGNGLSLQAIYGQGYRLSQE